MILYPFPNQNTRAQDYNSSMENSLNSLVPLSLCHSHLARLTFVKPTNVYCN